MLVYLTTLPDTQVSLNRLGSDRLRFVPQGGLCGFVWAGVVRHTHNIYLLNCPDNPDFVARVSDSETAGTFKQSFRLGQSMVVRIVKCSPSTWCMHQVRELSAMPTLCVPANQSTVRFHFC